MGSSSLCVSAAGAPACCSGLSLCIAAPLHAPRRHSLMGARIFGEAPSAAQLLRMLSEMEVVDASEGAPMGGAVSEHDSDDLSD